MEITQKRVKPEQPDEAEVSHHFVERLTTKITGDGVRISTCGVDLQLQKIPFRLLTGKKAQMNKHNFSQAFML
jgi:hypothetical protein